MNSKKTLKNKIFIPITQCFLILLYLFSTSIMASVNRPTPIGAHHHSLEKDSNNPRLADFNGFYIGANGGWGWSNLTNSETPFGTSAIADILPQSGKNNLNGSLFGAQLGFNKAIKNWMLGLEADFDGTTIGGTQQMLSPSIQGITGGGTPEVINLSSTNGFMVQNNIDWMTSIRGRIGKLWHSNMIYFTAGGAWERVSSKILINGSILTNLWNSSRAGSFSNNKAGFVVGAGIESMIAQHWTVRGEYLYYDFNSANNNQLAFLNCWAPGCGVNTSNSGNSINALRLGVNYKI